ncbi:MAG: quinol:cytochrome C oxidoreductase [Phycisphaerae bacterium]
MTKSNSQAGRVVAAGTAVLACIVGAAALTGCRGGRDDQPPRQFFPDLDDQMKWKPQEATQFFADGRTMRRPVAGSVPFGVASFYAGEQQLETTMPWARPWMEKRTDFLKADDRFYTGKDESGAYLDRMPVAVTRPMLELGKAKYDIYCAACHGYLGDGLGMVGRNWSYALPSYHDPKYMPGAMEDVIDEATKQPRKQKARTGQDGYLFTVARYGVFDATGANKMPGYWHALSERESWAVIAYIRALQEARNVSINDPAISQSQRETLLRTKPAPAPAPATPAPTTPSTGGQQ